MKKETITNIGLIRYTKSKVTHLCFAFSQPKRITLEMDAVENPNCPNCGKHYREMLRLKAPINQ